jgi:hypothetical protein
MWEKSWVKVGLAVGGMSYIVDYHLMYMHTLEVGGMREESYLSPHYQAVNKSAMSEPGEWDTGARVMECGDMDIACVLMYRE